MLLDTIKADSLAARKARDTEKATTLVTLYAEAARVGKDADNRESTDDEVVKVVRKFIKGIDDSLAVLKQPEAIALAQREKTYVTPYLPLQLTGKGLFAVIQEIIATFTTSPPPNLGLVMRALKLAHPGAYDGAEATFVIKEILS